MRIKTALLGTVAGVAILAGASVANANVHALASLNLSGLVATGLPAFNTFLFTGSSSVFLVNGGVVSDADLAPPILTAFAPGDLVGPLDSLVSLGASGSCGAVALANNAFTPLGGGAGFANYSYADQIVTDTKINATTGTPGGSGSSKIQLTYEFVWEPGQLGCIGSGIQQFLGSDGANVGDQLAQTEIGTASSSRTITASAPEVLGAFDYKLIIGSTVTVDATSAQDVPEPAPLGLLGLGLLGLGGATALRRRRAA